MCVCVHACIMRVYMCVNDVAVPRIQFLAVEIARNREGWNANLKRLFSKQAVSAKPEVTSSPS